MTVLILAEPHDLHAQAVMAQLTACGSYAELLDLSEFPSNLALSLRFEDEVRSFRLRRRGGGALNLEGVRSVWWRRPQPFRPSAIMNQTERRFVLSEASTAFQGMYQALEAWWINDPLRDNFASHKPYQLALAQRIGLEIPPTLMTSDVEDAREFWRRHEGEVVYKQFVALPDAWRETRRLRSEDEAHADGIAHAPVIFQRHVPAVADVRVTAVASELFAAATDVRDAAYPQDVRMNPDAKYEAHVLPSDTSDKLVELMRRLGLVYGAIDLRLTPDGRYVFLEINPAGHYLWIDRATGQPISAALARALTTPPANSGPLNSLNHATSRKS